MPRKPSGTVPYYSSLTIVLTLLLTNCAPKLERNVQKFNRDPGAASSSIGGRWSASTISTGRLSLAISRDFDSAEREQIIAMAKHWNDAVPSLDFFPDNHPEVENLEYEKLNDFDQDGEMGVYQSTGWYPEDVSVFALAITQYSGFRMNPNTTAEYVELSHADIILNYRNFSFALEPTANDYHLPSVILHEMGHFLGLPHQNDLEIASVMWPFIGTNEKKDTLSTDDTSTISDNYEFGRSRDQDLRADDYNNVPGNYVRGVIELRADGLCRHTENGSLKNQHFISLPSL